MPFLFSLFSFWIKVLTWLSVDYRDWRLLWLSSGNWTVKKNISLNENKFLCWPICSGCVLTCTPQHTHQLNLRLVKQLQPKEMKCSQCPTRILIEVQYDTYKLLFSFILVYGWTHLTSLSHQENQLNFCWWRCFVAMVLYALFLTYCCGKTWHLGLTDRQVKVALQNPFRLR